jgi:hypothetical protein
MRCRQRPPPPPPPDFELRPAPVPLLSRHANATEATVRWQDSVLTSPPPTPERDHAGDASDGTDDEEVRSPPCSSGTRAAARTRCVTALSCTVRRHPLALPVCALPPAAAPP